MTDGGCKPRSWEAVEDRQPPGPVRFRVTGTALCPTPGYVAEVSKREPQGINPKVLILDLTFQRPTGFTPLPLVEVKFEYREEIEAGKYEQVDLQPDAGVKDVQIVH